MTGASLADRCRRVLGRRRVPSTQGGDAARRLIAGDVDGALLAAQNARTARNALTRSEGFAVLAWVHLVRGERAEAEAAASVARRMRMPDRLLTVALVVESGGPSAGAALAFSETTGVLSLVAATRVFADQDRLSSVRAEIAALAPAMERAAFERLQVGLVALGSETDVDEVADRLAELGWTPVLYLKYASAFGRVAITELALRYLRLAADRGLADLDRVMEDPALADARAQPAFDAVRDLIAANARSAAGDSGS